MERLEMDFNNIDSTIKDIIDEFGYVQLKNIIAAIRQGSLGYFGQTYRLNTQVVCVWIREYLKSKKTSLGI
jgi:hypothetical protein